jgi:hypothetical protein
MPFLLRGMENEQGICLDFVGEAVSRFDEDENVPGIFVKAMLDISNKLSTLTMNDDYKPYVQVSSEIPFRSKSAADAWTGPGAVFQIPSAAQCSSEASIFPDGAVGTQH